MLDLLNKQNVETRRTLQFLTFALGARSPEKKNLFKSKHYLSNEESRLKVATRKGNMTQYGASKNRQMAAIENEQPRAKTSPNLSKFKFLSCFR